MKTLTIEMPSEVERILATLNQAKHEAYIVGGCVRDSLMGNSPNDWDITTSATPDQVKEVFPKTYDTGLKHGTVTVRIQNEYHEVTTYRTEGEYKDFRRPSTVEFVSDIKLDLGRRDFTINAMAYHPKEGFVDPYNGLADLEEELLRAVGNPKERFTEDALRILRGIRFSAELGFKLEEKTREAMLSCAHLLDHISKERVRDEMVKVLLSDRPNKLVDMNDWGLLGYVLPELVQCFKTPQNHPHHIYDVGHHTIKAIEKAPKDLVLRLTMLLHDIGKSETHTTDEDGIDHFYGHVPKSVKMSKKILKRLRFDNQTIKKVTTLVKFHDYHLEEELNRKNIKSVLCEIGADLFDQLLKVQEADARAQNPDKLEPKLKNLQDAKKIFADILENKECYSLEGLDINGKEVRELGVKNGHEIGYMLDLLLEFVISKPEINKKEILTEIVKDYKNK